MTVLIVDDQRVVREGLATILAHMPNVSVVGVAATGEEALSAVARDNPTVVLMDLRMPGMGGAEATRRIRTAWPDVQVVV